MVLTCQQLQDIVKEFSFVVHCDMVSNETLRIETPFLYPNGSNIDLFLGPAESFDTSFNNLSLSDLGQTTEYLFHLNIKPWTTARRKEIVARICDTLEVEHEGGEFRIRFNQADLKDLPLLMVRMTQACSRVADLIFTQRLQSMNTFREELEEFFDDLSLQYETPVVLQGRYHNDVEVDFRTRGMKVTSLVLTIATDNYGTLAHNRGNEVFRRWHDLNPYKSEHQFVTVYNTRDQSILRNEDLQRLTEVSLTLGFPVEKDSLATALSA